MVLIDYELAARIIVKLGPLIQSYLILLHGHTSNVDILYMNVNIYRLMYM